MWLVMWLAEANLGSEDWRPRPELNRGTRICSPLRHHSATWPRHGYIGRVISRQQHTLTRRLLAFFPALPQFFRTSA